MADNRSPTACELICTAFHDANEGMQPVGVACCRDALSGCEINLLPWLELQGLANGGGRPSLAGQRSGAWRRSMEHPVADLSGAEGSREQAAQDAPGGVLSASDFQVTTHCRWGGHLKSVFEGFEPSCAMCTCNHAMCIEHDLSVRLDGNSCAHS